MFVQCALIKKLRDPCTASPMMCLRVFVCMLMADFARAVATINDLVLCGENKGNIVAVADDVLEVLKNNGLALLQWLPPDSVAVHQQNRDSYGVNPKDCHTLMKEIKGLGWSWNQVKAIAVELSSDAERLETYNFNKKLADGSSGLLPPAMPANQLKAASLTASHTNTGLRCIRAQVVCDIPDISIEGKMSATKLADGDAQFGKAIEDGLQWLVISSKIAAACPKMLHLLQAAGNAPAQIQKAENEIQVLLRIHNAVKQHRMASGSVDWDKIRALVLRSKPPCQADVGFLMAFVARKAGSLDDAFLLQDLEGFHKMHVPTDRVVKGLFFQALAALELSPTNLAPFWTIAMLKTQYSCPDNKVRAGECKYLSVGDVKASVVSLKAEVEKAEGMLRECRQVLQGIPGFDFAKQIEILGKLDVRMVCLVLNKNEKNRQSFATMEHVCHQFVLDLQEALPKNAATLKSPWEGFVAAHAPASSASASLVAETVPNKQGLDFVSFDVSGQLSDPMDMLRKKGTNLDIQVSKTDDEKIHKVIEMSGGFLKLQPQQSAKCVSVSISDFLASWRVLEAGHAEMEDSCCA